MPNLPCLRKITCPGIDDPVGNFSSETEEANYWQAVGTCCDGTVKEYTSDLSCEHAEAILKNILADECAECPDDDGDGGAAAEITLGDITEHICLNSNYSQFITSSSDSDTLYFELFSGNLPTGLTFDGGETGCNQALVEGTATEAGTFTFGVRACDGEGTCGEKEYTITVLGIGDVLSQDAQVGAPFTWGFTVEGGVGPYTITLGGGALPPGLAISALDGTIFGTPTGVGDYPFVLHVVDEGTDLACDFLRTITVAPPEVTYPTKTFVGPLDPATFGFSGGLGVFRWKITLGVITTVTITVTPQGAGPFPNVTGTVKLYRTTGYQCPVATATLLGTGSIVVGTDAADINVTFSGAGWGAPNTLIAVYEGDVNFLPATCYWWDPTLSNILATTVSTT